MALLISRPVGARAANRYAKAVKSQSAVARLARRAYDVAMPTSTPPPVASGPTQSAAALAEAFGIDLSLGRENLRLTPTQRALQHQEALNLALAMEVAGRKLRERTEPTAAAPDLG